MYITMRNISSQVVTTRSSQTHYLTRINHTFYRKNLCTMIRRYPFTLILYNVNKFTDLQIYTENLRHFK